MINPRRFPDSEFRNPKLDVDALYRTGSLFMGPDFTLGVPLNTASVRPLVGTAWLPHAQPASERRLGPRGGPELFESRCRFWRSRLYDNFSSKGARKSH